MRGCYTLHLRNFKRPLLVTGKKYLTDVKYALMLALWKLFFDIGWTFGFVVMNPEEIDSVLLRLQAGVDLAMQRAKAWSKYMKEVTTYIEKKTQLGKLWKFHENIIIIIVKHNNISCVFKCSMRNFFGYWEWTIKLLFKVFKVAFRLVLLSGLSMPLLVARFLYVFSYPVVLTWSILFWHSANFPNWEAR